jgi:hypothetical protein
MKRKDALKIIDEIYTQFVDDWIKADLDNLEGFVPLNERILNALEKAGMLPPSTYLNIMQIQDNAWETEDED